MRKTIDFGIDLGIEKSCIAVFDGMSASVIKNNEGQEFTPSAVWMDKKGRLFVGRRAEQRLHEDSENAYSEFNLLLGTDRSYRFAASGRQMRPEELAAEMLKSLRGDVQQRLGEEIDAAVITVPAAFTLPQTDATQRAARMAGIERTRLIQQPIAAAIACGFQKTNNNTCWMVFDFGNSTSDVSIFQLRDKQIQIVTHRGDNQLGGKLINWEIIDKLLVPYLVNGQKLTDFKRGNPKLQAAFGKLRFSVEEARIRLSREDTALILIDPLCQDDGGSWVSFEYELKRSDIVPLALPLVERSGELCLKALEEAKLSPGDIQKMILVGDTTLLPFLRTIFQQKLGIPMEPQRDSMTIYAQGAAIFAGGIPMPGTEVPKAESPATGVHVETEQEPTISSPVLSDAGQSNGTTAGFKALDRQPLIGLIGVVLADGGVQVLLRKGAVLPARRRQVFQIDDFFKSSLPTSLWIPVVEVEQPQSVSHKRQVGFIEINFKKLNKEFPPDSEIEITIEVTESRQIKIKAYIPVIDHEFTDVLKLIGSVFDINKLTEEFNREKERFGRVLKRHEEYKISVQAVEKTIQKLWEEHALNDIQISIETAASNPDAAIRCQKRLLELKALLDEIEDIFKQILES